MQTADYWVEKLGLENHIEGGAFREIYRSPLLLKNLPDTFKGERNAYTAIYFLLKSGDFSAFHRIASDEGWHFYAGTSLTVYEIEKNGSLITHKLGRDIEKGETFQTTIKAGSWFGSRCEDENGYALVGCTVAPGFDFEDFELAEYKTLSKKYPQHEGLIKEMTRF